jgi:hypothetical protein
VEKVVIFKIKGVAMSTKYKESKHVPTSILCERLDVLSEAITKGKDSINREFTMRVPAELDRDADLVLCESARRLKKYDKLVNSMGCLFAEGVEFMTKTQIYDAIKEDFNKIVMDR